MSDYDVIVRRRRLPGSTAPVSWSDRGLRVAWSSAS